MKKRDNIFVDEIVELADTHFSRNDTADNMYAAIAAKLAEAEAQARMVGDPVSRSAARWAIRRVLFQPNLWPGLSPNQGIARRAALDRLLVLCKD